MKTFVGGVLRFLTGMIPVRWVEEFLRFHTSWLASRRDAGRGLCALFRYLDVVELAVDKGAMSREGGVHPKHRIMQYSRFFTARIRPGEHVLDVGCGGGVVAARMAEEGARVTGIDIEPERIEAARRHCEGTGVRFVCGDATQWLPETKFDVIVLSNVLEHLAGRQEFLRRLQLVHQPRCLLVRVPMLTRKWEVMYRHELGLAYFSDPSHQTEYTQESFAEEIQGAGLEVVHQEIDWGEIWAEVRRR